MRSQLDALRSILDSMVDGVAVVDHDGQFLLTNPAARQILRSELVETESRKWTDVYGFYLPDRVTPYPPGDLPLARALRGEPTDSAEVFVRNERVPDGLWIEVSTRPLHDSAGRVWAGMVVFRDITSLKRVEEERARLFASEREARRRAEETIGLQRTVEQRLRLLVDASGVLLGSLELSAMLPAILDLARQMTSADAYAIWRRENPGGEWRVLCASGLSEQYQKDTIQAFGHASMPDEPMVFEDVNSAPAIAMQREAYLAEGIRSLLVVPMRIGGPVSGSIAFYSRAPRRFEEVELRSACALANLAAAAIGSAELYQTQAQMRAEAEEAERRSAFLAEATAALGSSLDYETTLAQVARLAVPHVADWCAVHMLEPNGGIRQLAVAQVDPSKAEWARDLSLRYPPDPEAPHGTSFILRTGRSEMVAEITDAVLVEVARDEEHLRLLRQVGFTSYMGVPMTARGRTLGAITFVSAESGRRFSSADLAVAEHLGRRAGLAIDNALLYETAQREREAAEASLEAARRSEARFHTLLESGIIGILLGEHDSITEANDLFLEMLGYTREDLAAGRLRVTEITAPESLEDDLRAREQMLDRGACAPYEKEFLHKEGSRVPALVGGALLEPPPRRTWVCFALDLTERHQLEQRLRESQKLESIGLLAGGIAHDFNNLLTGIMGNASLALDDLPAGSPLRPILDNVVHASERAAHLTRQMLAYSGRGRFVIQRLNLSELVREISSLLEMSVPKKVQLRLDLTETLPPVEADSSQLQQLVMNLVLNGAEAVGETVGTVLVTTGVQEVDEEYVRASSLSDEIAPGKYVYLEVHDTGCGMDEPTRSRIFDPFFTTKFTGRGLGLAAVLGIVRGHKGDIKVYSAPGRGSTFKVLLPAAEGYLEKEPATDARQDLRGIGTILLVDDEAIVLHAGKAALERYGYEVLLASDGQEGVEVFRREADRVSLVLLDLTMPVMSGEEAFDHLKSIKPDVRVIVSSGYNEVEAVRRFTGSGIAAFLQKPYTSVRLAETVKLVLEGKGMGLASGR